MGLLNSKYDSFSKRCVADDKYVYLTSNFEIYDYICMVDMYDKFDGYLKYKGEICDGKKNGIGIEYEKNKIIYEGEFLDDLRHE